MFVAVNVETGAQVAKAKPSHIEAQADAREFGPGHAVKTIHDDEAIAQILAV